MRVLYILRTEWGAIGTNASVMFPMCADEHNADICIFETNNDEQKKGNITFSRPDMQIVSAKSNCVYERARKLKECLRDFQPNIIHAFYHADLAKLIQLSNISKETSLIVDVRSPITTNSIKRKMALRWRNLKLGQRADLIFALNKGVFRNLFPIGFLKKFRDVPTGVSIPSSLDQTGGLAPSQLRNFVYVGSIAKIRNLEILVRGFLSFISEQKHQDAHLYLVGNGNQKKALQVKFASQNLHFLDVIQNYEVFDFLKKMHVGITHVPEKIFDSAISLKSFEYAFMRLPIMASKSANMGKLEILGYPVNRYGPSITDVSNKFSEFYHSDSSLYSVEPAPEIENYLLSNDWSMIFHNKVWVEYCELAK